ncbi:LamG-like jellyroll fold domain-containing protein [Ferruginibacter sp.]|uniref:LamG-like jellyroll fold domain-containing protein n=1 Tax=Ferruginibacter sp. TaxID=1940288 RepID=UPI002657FAFB|nr:LamG-like jellyroll fold domain-containing protein [Ferruginibacter sp.]
MKKYNLIIVTALFVTSSFLACTKADYNDTVTKGDPPPVPGGFVNSSEVAASSLLAYWNFDDSKAETKSKKTPLVDSNSSFVAGLKGRALQLNKGYLLYPTIDALNSTNALASCSVSLWIKVVNNGSTFSEFFTLARDTTKENDWLNILNVGVETGHAAGDANMDLHTWIGTYPAGTRNGADNINDYGAVAVDYQTVPNSGNWIHYVMRYDASTENIDLYANSIRVSNNNFRHRGGFGPIVSPTPTQVVLGGFSNTSTHFPLSSTLGFHGLLNGAMDELRVYSKALTDVEISALYQLEKQGR